MVAPALLRLRFASMAPSGEAPGAIDELGTAGRPLAAQDGTVPRGVPIYVSGWMLVPGVPDAQAAVAVTVDGAFATLASGGIERPDVAAIHGSGAARSGFEAIVHSGDLAEGVHTLAAVRIVDAMTYRTGPERRLTIVPSALRIAIETPVVAGMSVQLDALADDAGGVRTPGAAATFDASATIRVFGWAADVERMQYAAGVYALVDGVHLFRGRYGMERADVAAVLGTEQLRFSGFEIRIDAGSLSPGDHVVSVVALTPDGGGRSAPAPASPFAIAPDSPG